MGDVYILPEFALKFTILATDSCTFKLTETHDVFIGWHESQYELISSLLLAGSVLGIE